MKNNLVEEATFLLAGFSYYVSRSVVTEVPDGRVICQNIEDNFLVDDHESVSKIHAY